MCLTWLFNINCCSSALVYILCNYFCCQKRASVVLFSRFSHVISCLELFKWFGSIWSPIKKRRRHFSFKNPRDFIFHYILTPTQKPSEVNWPTLPSSFAFHLLPVTILLSSSLLPSAGPPGCWAGGPQSKSYHSLRWAETTGRIPTPVHPLAPPSFQQWRSCRSRSVQTARAPRPFSPPRTPASQHTSADGEGRSAPSSWWEPRGPTGQWPSRPLVWSEAISLQLWTEEMQLRNIFHRGSIFKKVTPTCYLWGHTLGKHTHSWKGVADKLPDGQASLHICTYT